jgi:hypothetical protein
MELFDEPPARDVWHLRSAGSKGITFHCDYTDNVDRALEKFMETMCLVMCAWPSTVTGMTITLH